MSDSRWMKIGDVVGDSSKQSSKSVMYEGKVGNRTLHHHDKSCVKPMSFDTKKVYDLILQTLFGGWFHKGTFLELGFNISLTC